jgi:hypothetical protein
MRSCAGELVVVVLFWLLNNTCYRWYNALTCVCIRSTWPWSSRRAGMRSCAGENWPGYLPAYTHCIVCTSCWLLIRVRSWMSGACNFDVRCNILYYINTHF